MEKISRYRHGLVEAGTWVIIFSFWSAVKTAGWLFLEHNSIENLMGEYALSSDSFVKVVFLVIFIGIVLIDLSIRLRTGLSARSDGLYGGKSSSYLVWTAILMAGSFLSIVNYFVPLSGEYGRTEFESAAFILELSSFAILLELFICAVKLRRIRRAA